MSALGRLPQIPTFQLTLVGLSIALLLLCERHQDILFAMATWNLLQIGISMAGAECPARQYAKETLLALRDLSGSILYFLFY